MKPFDLPSLRGIRPRKFGLVSWSDHVPFAFDLVAEMRPKLLVELGTHSGESYFAFCQSVQENNTGTSCYAVDTWKGDEQAGFYGEDVFQAVARHNHDFYASFSYLVRGTFDDAVAQFADGSIDLLHIDGLHTYAAVKHDFETWLPKVSSGGIVLFHDVAARHDDFGAWKLWDEIKSSPGSFTFFHGWGLGVWRKDPSLPLTSPFLQALFSGHPSEAENIRRYYGLAAENLRLRATNDQLRDLVPASMPQGPGPFAAAPSGNDPLYLQVYFPRDGSYHEEASAKIALKAGEWLRLEVDLPPDWRGARLRVDPVNACGLIEIEYLRVATRVFEQTLWKCQGRDELRPLQFHGANPLDSDDLSLRLLCFEGDPQIFTPEIALKSFDEPLKLEIFLRVLTDWPTLADVLRSLVEQVGQVPPLRQRIEELKAGIAEGEAKLALGEAAASAQASQALAQAEHELEVSRYQAGQLGGALLAAWQFDLGIQAEIAREEAHARTLEAQLQGMQEALASSHEQLLKTDTLLHEQRQARLEAQQELDCGRREVAALAARLEAEQEQLRSARTSLADSHEELIETQALLSDERRARQQAEQDVEGLEAELAGLQGELSASARQLAAEHKTAVAARQDLQRELQQTQAALHDAEKELDHVRHLWKADHGRVASMQNSGSWKVTLPFRALQRSLSGKRPAAPAHNGAEPAAANGAHPPAAKTSAENGVSPAKPAPPAYTIHFDAPQDWNVPQRLVHVRGWYLPLESKAIPAAISARCGDQEVKARLGIPRPDVIAHQKLAGADVECGFEFDLDLPAGPSRVVITVTSRLGHSWVAREFSARAPYGNRPRRQAAADPAKDYARWVELYDKPSAAALRQMRVTARQLHYQPLISVLLPTYNSAAKWLEKAMDSVRRQVYPNWELCIADDASTQPQVRATLERYAAADSRIKIVYRELNGHISAASNSALELATGDFIALLDHDDELAPQALYAVAAELNADPGADLIYSDEDKIDEEGRRFDAYFKPDWNPDLLTGQNYISHLGVYRAERVREVGGFRLGFEGCQDWDLALRVTEIIPPERIRHIPRVLYHWRAIAGSTALVLSEKDYVGANSKRLLEEHCQRTGTAAVVEAVPGGHCRLRRRVPEPAPLISIIIPTRNRISVLRPCMESILERSTYARYEILLVDNQSDEPETVAYLHALRGEDIRVLPYDHPFNFSAMNNFAVEHARGDLICLLNNDMEVITPDWMEEMASHACRPEIGAVGAMLYYPNDTIQHAGCVLGIGGVAGHAFKTFPRGTDGQYNRARLVQNYTAVTAACLMIRRSTFLQVGGLEEERLRVGFNDIDFCLRVHTAGYRNLWTPFAEFYHHESVSRGLEDTLEKHERFQGEVAYMRQRWNGLLEADPAYNPNLTLEHENFTLANPPRTQELAPAEPAPQVRSAVFAR